VSLKSSLKGCRIFYSKQEKTLQRRNYQMDNVILEQLSKHFKEMIQEIMLKEREKYLKENPETRGSGYYTRTPKTILGDMELEIPRTRDGNFKPSIISCNL